MNTVDYSYFDLGIIEVNTECGRYAQLKRLCAYVEALRSMEMICESHRCQEKVGFWNRESNIEKRIYMKMKQWEDRHPIIGIVMCTILGVIFLNLVSGIILEAMILFLLN